MASLILSVDAMGGDAAPLVVLDGLAIFAARRPDVSFQLHGRADEITAGVAARGLSARCQIVHQDGVVSMSDKPSAALRKAKGTSLWGAVQAVKSGEAAAAVSAGNTGALMAFSMLALRKMEGVHRPAMTALWPTLTGRAIVLDVGANLDADCDQLVTFAIMGEAYARALTGKAKPQVVVFMLSVIVPVILLPFAVAVWVPVGWEVLGWLFLTASLATAGHYTMTLAFTAAPLTVTQPVTFLQLIWATSLGVLVFGEPADGYVMLGGALIIAAISIVTWREARRKAPILPPGDTPVT